MANKKKDSFDTEDGYTNFDEAEQAVRDEVLAGPEDVAPAVNDNRELERADRHVNTEVTTPAERRLHSRHARIASGNLTAAGMPSDVHQSLVTLSNMHRDAAAAFDEVSAVLDKYQHVEDGLNPDVRAHLEAYAAELQPRAALYRKTRTLLEEHV